MLQTVLLTSVCLFIEIKSQDFHFLDSPPPDEGIFKSDKNEDYLHQEMANEELILDDQRFPLADSLESSGDFEGSGFNEIIKDVKSCIESGQDTVCSNNGQCKDDRCVCDSVEIEIDNTTIPYRHSGAYCEECPYCRAQKCQQFLPCIECHSFQKEQTCSSYCQFQYEIVKEVRRDSDRDEKFCDIENSNGCFFQFKYYYDSRNVVFVQYQRDYFRFNGLKFLIFTFWGVVIYIFALMAAVPRICCRLGRKKLRKSRTSLSRGHDVLRLEYFQ